MTDIKVQKLNPGRGRPRKSLELKKRIVRDGLNLPEGVVGLKLEQDIAQCLSKLATYETLEQITGPGLRSQALWDGVYLNFDVRVVVTRIRKQKKKGQK